MLKKSFPRAITLLCFFVFFTLFVFQAGRCDADASAVDALSGKVDELYSNEELAKGRWRKVSSVEYKNTGTGLRERDTIYAASRRVVMVHESFDRGNEESRTFVTRYATTDFAGLLQGLSPGTASGTVDRLLGAPYATQGPARGYRNEPGSVWVAVTFRGDKAYLLDLHAPPEGGGEDEAITRKITSQFDSLARRL
ncbi:MAG: hypothetical protein LBG29_07325 [Synergistaceae bacterium]|jgi:hypothetical protein|nr:hypothetical protein [Synergistaceae bacterium]